MMKNSDGTELRRSLPVQKTKRICTWGHNICSDQLTVALTGKKYRLILLPMIKRNNSRKKAAASVQIILRQKIIVLFFQLLNPPWMKILFGRELTMAIFNTQLTAVAPGQTLQRIMLRRVFLHKHG